MWYQKNGSVYGKQSFTTTATTTTTTTITTTTVTMTMTTATTSTTDDFVWGDPVNHLCFV